ncbi:MAG: ABC transporter ATP-binding protein [Hydrogenophilales bacterium]|nr:ABC transporter ATP-binding protein [Hydrogenophilales bacterium]
MSKPCPLSTQIPGPAVGRPAIELKGLGKAFPGRDVPALDGIDLAVPKGTIYGILGPNGAGKTTLMSILGGLLKPTSGAACIDGHDTATGRAAIKRILGLVPQEPAVYPTLTARENLDYFGRMQGLSGAHLQARIQACLELAEMAEHADRRVDQFSGGYRRRLNMVIGLIHEPRILILDEPTVAIDPHSRSLIHQRLRELHAAGITILISTHYMEEAEHLCQRIAIINHGKLLVQGTVPDLLAMQRDKTIQLQLEGDPPADLEARLEGISGLLEVHVAGRCVLIVAEQPDSLVAPLMRAIHERGLGVRSMSFGTASLEQVFLALTGSPGAPK